MKSQNSKAPRTNPNLKKELLDGVENSTVAVLILRKFRNEYRLGLIFLYSSGVKMECYWKND